MSENYFFEQDGGLSLGKLFGKGLKKGKRSPLGKLGKKKGKLGSPKAKPTLKPSGKPKPKPKPKPSGKPKPATKPATKPAGKPKQAGKPKPVEGPPRKPVEGPSKKSKQQPPAKPTEGPIKPKTKPVPEPESGGVLGTLKTGAQAAAEEAAQIAVEEAESLAVQTITVAAEEAERAVLEAEQAVIEQAREQVGLEEEYEAEAEAEEEAEEEEAEVVEEIKPVTQMSAAERKKAVLTQLEQCLPKVQKVDDISQILVDCISQGAGELYLPSNQNIKELSAGLRMMLNQDVDLTDPEIVKVLLYGTRSTKLEKVLDWVEGYDEVMAALSKITQGEKISGEELEALETATIETMEQAGGGCGCGMSNGVSGVRKNRKGKNQLGGGCGTSGFYFPKNPSHPVWGPNANVIDPGLYGRVPSGQRGGVRRQCGGSRKQRGGGNEGGVPLDASAMEWINTVLQIGQQLGVGQDLDDLQRILADGQISEEEFKELAEKLINVAQKNLSKTVKQQQMGGRRR